MRLEFLHDDRRLGGTSCDDPCTEDLRRPWASVWLSDLEQNAIESCRRLRMWSSKDWWNAVWLLSCRSSGGLLRDERWRFRCGVSVRRSLVGHFSWDSHCLPSRSAPQGTLWRLPSPLLTQERRKNPSVRQSFPPWWACPLAGIQEQPYHQSSTSAVTIDVIVTTMCSSERTLKPCSLRPRSVVPASLCCDFYKYFAQKQSWAISLCIIDGFRVSWIELIFCKCMSVKNINLCVTWILDLHIQGTFFKILWVCLWTTLRAIVDGQTCLWQALTNFASCSCPHCTWDPVSRWLKVLSTFWLMDAEMVIDDRFQWNCSCDCRTWRDRKDSTEVMTGRTWHYHGMNHKFMRTRTSVLQRFWRDHIPDKNGRRGNIQAKCIGRTKDRFLPRDDCNGQGGRMERRRLGGVEIRGGYVDLH